MGAILVLGGKPKMGSKDAGPEKDDDSEPKEKDEPSSGAAAREEAVKALARGLGVTVKDWRTVDKALQAHYEACEGMGGGDEE